MIKSITHTKHVTNTQEPIQVFIVVIQKENVKNKIIFNFNAHTPEYIQLLMEKVKMHWPFYVVLKSMI